MGGFMSGLFSVVGPKLEELHAREDATRAPRAQAYANMLSQYPQGSPQWNEAWEQINKIYGKNKQAKEILGRIKQFTDQMPQRAASGQAALPAPGQATPAPSPAASQQGPGIDLGTQVPGQPRSSGPPPVGGSITDVPIAGTGANPVGSLPQPGQPAMPPRHQGALSKVGHALGSFGKNFAENTLGVGVDRRLREARQTQEVAEMGAGLTTPTSEQQKRSQFESISRALDEGVEKKYWTKEEAEKKRSEAFDSIMIGLKGSALTSKLTYRTGLARPGTDPDTGKPYEGTYTVGFNAEGQPVSYNKEGQKQSAARRYEQGVVSGDWLKRQIEEGKHPLGADGQPLDPKDIEPGMVARRNDLGHYLLENPHLTTTNFDNTVWIRNSYTGEMTPAGAQKTITNRSHEAVVWDDASQSFKTVALYGQTIPESPQATPRTIIPGGPPVTPQATSAPLPTALPPSPSPASPTTPPPPARTAQLQKTLPTPPPFQVGNREIKGTPASQYNAIQQRVGPPRQAIVQLFGSRENPNLNALVDYADLAADEGAKKRIGLAVRLARKTMLEAEQAGGEIGAHIGPISASTGGLGAWASNAFGVPVKVTEAENEQMRNAIDDMAKHNPREVQAFNAELAAYGTVGGMRKAVGGLGTQAGMASLETDIPLIGYNTTTPQDFLDKMEHLGQEPKTMAEGLPKGTLDTAFIEEKIHRLREKYPSAQPRKTEGTRKLQAPGKKDPSQMTTEELLNALK